MFLPAWTVWRIQNVDRMKLSWRPCGKVEGLKEQTQKRINHHLISKGRPQMFQSEGALCFTTPKAEHYVSGWKQVLKMSGEWLDIQVWRKWNRKLHNNKKYISWAKMTRTQKGAHSIIFSTLWKGGKPTTCLSDSIPTCIVVWDCSVGFYGGFRETFLLWRCAGHCSAMLKCPVLFSKQVAGLYLKLLCMPRSRFWGISKSWFFAPSFMKAGSYTQWYLMHLNDAPVSLRDYFYCSLILKKQA